jgi:hypothetical protein
VQRLACLAAGKPVDRLGVSALDRRHEVGLAGLDARDAVDRGEHQVGQLFRFVVDLDEREDVG